MLAQMNGLLEPDDAADIAKKIEESPFAKALVQRIHDVSRRIRLAAPPLNERGPNLDPNTVAEYLDHVLADDRVPDFENVCLKSDMHLAEVACCHQILALVLGHPAEIDQQSRRRMYQLPDVLVAREAAEGKVELPDELAGASGAADSATVTAGAASGPSPAATAPARSRQRNLLRWAAAAAIVVFGFVVLAWSTGQFDPDKPLGRLVWAPNQTATPPAKEPAADAPAAPAAKPEEVIQPPASDAEERIVPPADEPAPLPPDKKAAEGSTVPPAPLPPKTEEMPNTPDETKPADPAPATPGPAGDATAPPADGSQPPAVPRVESMPPIARMVSDTQILLRYTPEDDGWRRLPGKAVLMAKQALLALPTYRPEIAMNSGVTARLMGPTRVVLRSPAGEEPPGLDIDFGRILLIPAAKPGTQIVVGFAGGRVAGTLTFVQPESVAAVEVLPVRHPGSDPEQAPASWAVSLYAGSGELTLESASRPVVRMSAGSKASLGTAGWTVSAAEIPRWLTSEPLPLLDEQASRLLEQAMTADRPALQTMLEMSEHRRREVRWLAARCLVFFGHVDRLCAALNDLEAKNEWADAAGKLIEAVAVDPKIAAAVRTTLQRQYGDAGGAELYRMLWGYTESDFANGEAAKLVNALDSESLAHRVLAFQVLKDLTGLVLSYRPDMPANQRKAAIQRWKEKLDAGELRIGGAEPKPARPAPAPVPSAEPPAPTLPASP